MFEHPHGKLYLGEKALRAIACPRRETDRYMRRQRVS